MKISHVVFIVVFLFMCNSSQADRGGKLKMWYDKPAKVWNEALPVGNGRLAAMVFGDPAIEKIQLNEGTFWSGGPSRNDNPEALKALPEVRQLIFDGKFKEAEDLINQKIRASQLHGSMYQVLGNLNLAFEGHGQYLDYYRELDLERAIATTTYKLGETTYKREVFASQPDQVIVIRLTADRQGALSFDASMDGLLQKSIQTIDAQTIEMTGLSDTHEGVTGQVKFDSRTKIQQIGGTVSADAGVVKVRNANEVVILISMATNFVDYKTLTANEQSLCSTYLSKAASKSYDELLSAHIAAFQKYFNRTKLNLGTSAAASLPTDVRISNFAKTSDPELVSMYFQFGRYLLISCSQPGGQAATLQGLWNDSRQPAWDSKYTININTEMNYWPAEKCNLAEMHEPMIDLVKELSQTGKETAQTMYGCRGWVAHHNTDIWRISGVVDGAFWGMWPMGGAWLSQHLWEKFLYNGDLNYLESAYPVMKSACEFYQDFLVEEPSHKWLVVSPSISPENAPAGRTTVCAGTTMDNQILFDLFTKTIRVAGLLKKDAALMAEFKKTLNRMPPMQIGQYGQLQEWMEDLDNPDDKHRHVSHLYGLYPSSQISATSTPELFKAARTSLIQRGDVSTGWSMGWKVNLWARLLDGNHALKLITDQLTLVDPVAAGRNGGTYPNFFDAHPPFQIDGNFGCTSGIAEMLMQSHDGAISILPALPDAWKDGDISGLRTQGGFEVQFEWKDAQVVKLSIKSNLGGNCRIRLAHKMTLKNGKSLSKAKGENPNIFFQVSHVKAPIISSKAKTESVQQRASFLYDLPTKAGETYELILK